MEDESEDDEDRLLLFRGLGAGAAGVLHLLRGFEAGMTGVVVLVLSVLKVLEISMVFMWPVRISS